MDKNVLLNVQKQKIKQTENYLVEWMIIKESFLKQHIPIQQRLIKNLDNAAQITLLRLRQASSILKEERELQLMIIQKYQKSLLNDEKRFAENIKAHSSKISQKKQDQNQSHPEPQLAWSSNIDKAFTCLSNSLKKRILDSQAFIQVISKSQDELIKQQARYRNQLKKCVKGLEKGLEKIDFSLKQQDLIVSNIRKQSKNKDRNGNFYLVEYKKLQNQITAEISSFGERGKDLFNFMKTVLDNEKASSKKLREVLDAQFKAKNLIFKDNQFDQRFLGVLVVMEDSVAESRKQYFNKYLLSEDQIQIIKTLVPEPNMNGAAPNLECVVRYLKLECEDFLAKLNVKSKLQFFASNLCYKKWPKTSLAKGWLITSYVPVTIYLTYDECLSMISVADNELVRKVNKKQATVNRVDNGNVVLLEETTKGFFSDGKEEYQIKFESFDSLEEFLVFIGTKE